MTEHQLQQALRTAAPTMTAQASERLDERVAQIRSGRPQRRLRLPRFQLTALMPAVGVACAAALAVMVAVGSQPERASAPQAAVERSADSNTAAEGSGSGISASDSTLAQPTAPQGAAPDIGMAAPAEPPIMPTPYPDDVDASDRTRQVEQASMLTVAVRDVGPAVQQAIAITDSLDGIVMRADAFTGDSQHDVAQLDLRIPTANLRGALTRLSQLGDVQARTDLSQDITATVNSAADMLREARAERRGLLAELQRADRERQRQEIRDRLIVSRQRIAAAQQQVRSADQRTQMARVALTVQTRDEQTGQDDDGRFGVDDAWDDAVRALDVIGGVLIIVAVVSSPFVILTGLAAVIRRRRK
jgi:hypothetical protein